MTDLAIRAVGLSKQYTIGVRRRHTTLRDQLSATAQRIFSRNRVGSSDPTKFWAMEDVSFEIRKGEVVGVIGRNGAGKSTLLKILARITEPTLGFADIQGRVGSLLEVGTGFHPELTGRENISLNGAILGMRKQEIEKKREAIVAFAEIEKFIDTPVKHYSSGMYLRLAFAVAAHLQPEILLVDEVLAVGDVDFQKKCLGKMGDVASEGRTVVFVSHSMAAITQLCQRVLWIHGGHLKLDGPAATVVSAYLASAMTGRATWKNPTPQQDSKSGDFCIHSARVLSDGGRPVEVVGFQGRFAIEIEYEVRSSLRDLSIICALTDGLGNSICTSWDSDKTGWRAGTVREPGRYVSRCRVPPGILRPGGYYLSIGAGSARETYPGHENALFFEVSEVGYHLNPGRGGIITPLLDWEITRVEEPAAASLGAGPRDD